MSTRLLLKSLLVCLTLILASELGLRWAARQPAFHALFQEQLPSREVLQDRLKAYARDPRPLIVLMGDSVFFGSGMHAHQVPRWKKHTVSAYLRQELPSYAVLDLSLDGLLPWDACALYREVQRLQPAFFLFEFNYRMWADKFRDPSAAFSRPWLATVLPATLSPVSPTLSLGDRILSHLRRVSYLFRYSECARSALFFPSREETFNQWLRVLLPARSLRENMDADILLQLKIKPYYLASPLSEKAMPLQALRWLRADLEEHHVPYMAFSTPQNLELIQDLYAEPSFNANLKQIAGVFAHPTQSPKGRYVDLLKEYPSAAFYDHCHLTPEYNARLAKRLGEDILSVLGRTHVQE